MKKNLLIIAFLLTACVDSTSCMVDTKVSSNNSSYVSTSLYDFEYLFVNDIHDNNGIFLAYKIEKIHPANMMYVDISIYIGKYSYINSNYFNEKSLSFYISISKNDKETILIDEIDFLSNLYDVNDENNYQQHFSIRIEKHEYFDEIAGIAMLKFYSYDEENDDKKILQQKSLFYHYYDYFYHINLLTFFYY